MGKSEVEMDTRRRKVVPHSYKFGPMTWSLKDDVVEIICSERHNTFIDAERVDGKGNVNGSVTCSDCGFQERIELLGWEIYHKPSSDDLDDALGEAVHKIAGHVSLYFQALMKAKMTKKSAEYLAGKLQDRLWEFYSLPPTTPAQKEAIEQYAISREELVDADPAP